jgi:hypothetical protein
MRLLLSSLSSCLLVAASLLAATTVQAADQRLDGLKQIERNICVRGGNTAPGAPKNLKLVPQYCTCVAQHYFDHLPTPEVDQLMGSGQSDSIDQHKDERMAQARAACQRG